MPARRPGRRSWRQRHRQGLVAAGAPIAEASRIPQIAARFVESARQQGDVLVSLRPDRARSRASRGLLLGEQPVWEPADWRRMLAGHRRLREQIRRPKAKGVTFRRVEAAELEPTDRCMEGRVAGAEWLGSRRMVPMGFLVALEPFNFAREHRYSSPSGRGR